MIRLPEHVCEGKGVPIMNKRYYLDHNATTPVRPEVIDAMLPYLKDGYGNASSLHAVGREARRGLDESRERIATLIGAEPDEIYFTGCGTESDNMALRGVLAAAGDSRNGLVTTTVEHSAILRTAEVLGNEGRPVACVGVDNQCRTDFDALRDAVGDNTALVSVMHANNETGVIQDIGEAANIAHDAGALFHTDAVQSGGKLAIDVKDMGVDLLSLSAHKMNAMKGVGLLYVRKGVHIEPIMTGGSHEGGLRPGTENIPGIVGFAKAFELLTKEREASTKKLRGLRDRLEAGLEEKIPDLLFNGRGAGRVPTTANISFPGIDGEALLLSLDLEGIAVSTGSACRTGSVEPSHVLVAMGVPSRVAQGSLRFSMGWGTTDETVDHVLAVLPEIVERLRLVAGGM